LSSRGAGSWRRSHRRRDKKQFRFLPGVTN
jgi:hypothetical protein